MDAEFAVTTAPGFSTMGSSSLYQSVTKIQDDILSRVRARVRVTFRSDMCKVRMHDFETAECNLHRLTNSAQHYHITIASDILLGLHFALQV